LEPIDFFADGLSLRLQKATQRLLYMLGLGSTLRTCSPSSTGISGMSDGSHANIS
jgi:hypothetical protein